VFALDWRRRPAVLPSLALLAGIALPAGAVSRSAFPLVLALLLLAALMLPSRSRPPAARVGLCVVALLFGSWIEAHDAREHETVAGRLCAAGGEASDLHFTGRLLAAPEVDIDGSRRISLRGSPEPPAMPLIGPATISLRVLPGQTSGPDLDSYSAGDLLRVWCRLRRPVANGNPGASDPRVGLRARGIHAIGTAKNPIVVERLESGPAGPYRAADLIRRYARERLDEALGRTGPERALVGAMLLGDRAAIGPWQQRLLRDAGLIHLVAISGIHVGLLTWMLLGLERRAGMGPWARWVSLVVLLIGFAIVVGGRPSVHRAVFGALVFLFGRCLGREGDPLNGLALLAAALAVPSPALLSEPGFQLTFLATGGILLFHRSIAARIPFPLPVASAVGVSMSAYLATAPVVAWHFGRLAPAGLLTNLAAVPLCGSILCCGYVGMAVHGVPAVGAVFDGITLVSARALMAVASVAGEWDSGAFPVGAPSVGMIGAYFSLLLVSRLGRFRRQRVVSALLVSLIGLMLIRLHVGPPPAPRRDRLHVSMIDVGQGLAVAVQGRYGSLLVDTGGHFSLRYDPGERIVVPFLVNRGTRRLDALLITHDHLDHVGGAAAVLRDLEVGELWLGPGAGRSSRFSDLAAGAVERGVAVVLAEAGRSGQPGGIPVRVLAPPRTGGSASINDRSLVLLIGSAPTRLLVPGDLEGGGEAELLASRAPVRAEALVVGHHGSRGGSTEPFLDRVRPRYGLVSCGRGNPFGHPHREVTERFGRRGVPLFRTDRLGLVELVDVGHGWEVRTTLLPYVDRDEDE